MSDGQFVVVSQRPAERELEEVVDLAGFGAALRRVRQHKGLTLRGMEQHLRGLTDRPADRWGKSKIEQAEKGRQLEERWVLRYLSAAGVPGPELPPWVMALRRALASESGDGAASWEEDADRPSTPFPGLRAFGTEQQGVFFARNREIGELVEVLGPADDRPDRRAVLVVGPSGCGKSSLLRAGLLPTMAREQGWWALAPFWPGSDPIGALARELTAAGQAVGLSWTLPEVRRRLQPGDLRELVEQLLLAAPAPRRSRLLIAVDQFEELLTLTPPAELARFVGLLGTVADGPVAVVATLSAEFVDALLGCRELDGLDTRLVTVRPLERDALAMVITEPARVAGIEVEPELTARLVADTDGGEALPLLAYTLAQLADGVRPGGRFDAARYERLGGVHGTLARQADRALEEAVAAGGRDAAAVIRSLLSLVTVDENGRPTRRRAARDQLPAIVLTELEPFLARRLLTTDHPATGGDDGDDDAGGGVVQVAHEAFLSAWEPLAAVIADSSAALRARRGIEQAAVTWAAHDRAPDRLWERGQLAAALADTGADLRAARDARPPENPERPGAVVRSRAGGRWWPSGPRAEVVERVALSDLARDFLRTSVRRDRLRRSRATGVLALLLVLALVAVGVAVVQLRFAQDQQRLAVARQTVSAADAARAADPRLALLLGEAALHIHPDTETRSELVRTLLTNQYRATLAGHTGEVISLAFAPGGRTLATGAGDGDVILWDLGAPGGPVRGPTLPGHAGFVNSVAFSPDGRTLATGGVDDTVVLWDLTGPGGPVRGPTLPSRTGYVNSVAFAPDGRTLAVGGGDGTAVLWDLADPGRPRRGPVLPNGTGSVQAVAFAPDGRTLATAGLKGTAVLWNLTGPGGPARGPALPGHSGNVDSVAFSPDGRTVATGGADRTVRLYDVTDPARPAPGPALSGYSSEVMSVAFSPDGRTIAGAGGGGAVLYDLTDPGRPRRVPTVIARTGFMYAVAFAPDGRTLATAEQDGTALLWDVTRPDGPRHATAHPPGTEASTSVFSPDGRTLATTGAGRTVLLDDVTDPARPVRGPTLPGPAYGVTSMAFSRDGRILALAGTDGTVVAWDLSDPARPRRGPTLPGHRQHINAAAFSPDGHTLAATGVDGRPVLWDLTDLDRPRRGPGLPGPTPVALSLAFSPDGRTLASAGVDGTAVLWDLTDPGRPRHGPTLSGHTGYAESVAFAPDGRSLATGGTDGTAVLWDLTDPGRPRRTPLTGHTSPVRSVAFAPDARLLASTSEDGTAILWDVSDPARPERGLTFPAYTGQVKSVAFAPDGHTLATDDPDGAATLWNLADLANVRDHALHRACEITQGGMSPAEWAQFVPGLDYEDTCA